MTSNTLYYFFSTVSQSAAALLGVMVAGVAFAESSYSGECQAAIGELWRLQGQEGPYPGSSESMLRDAQLNIDSIKRRLHDRTVGHPERTALETRLGQMEAQHRRLSRAKIQLAAGRSIPKSFLHLMLLVFYGLAALPFVEELTNDRVRATLMGIGVIGWAYVLQKVHRIMQPLFNPEHFKV